VIVDERSDRHAHAQSLNGQRVRLDLVNPVDDDMVKGSRHRDRGSFAVLKTARAGASRRRPVPEEDKAHNRRPIRKARQMRCCARIAGRIESVAQAEDCHVQGSEGMATS